jgi:inner membrane protein involved in colicin E2 resistance
MKEMRKDTLTIKMFVIGFIGLICFIASMFILGLVQEREGRYSEAKTEVGQTWGAPVSMFFRVHSPWKAQLNLKDGSAASLRQ